MSGPRKNPQAPTTFDSKPEDQWEVLDKPARFETYEAPFTPEQLQNQPLKIQNEKINIMDFIIKDAFFGTKQAKNIKLLNDKDGEKFWKELSDKKLIDPAKPESPKAKL
jgi:hypothetical protein